MTSPQKKSRVFSSWQYVFPNDANHLGTMFGGKVMAVMDSLAGIVAAKYCGKAVVTASMEALDFKLPVQVGDRIEVRARVVYTSRSTMVIKTELFAEDPKNGLRRHCTTAYFNMAAMTETKKISSVPPLFVETEDEKREYSIAAKIQEAARRRRREIKTAH